VVYRQWPTLLFFIFLSFLSLHLRFCTILCQFSFMWILVFIFLIAICFFFFWSFLIDIFFNFILQYWTSWVLVFVILFNLLSIWKLWSHD
jgi:hypothetical protein